MNVFLQASKVKLRITTSKGNLSIEQLWDLTLDELDKLAVELEEQYKDSGTKSFIKKSRRTEKDKETKLKFDVVMEVLTIKAAEIEEEKEQRENQEFNEKLITLISEKQDEELKGKSVKQLTAMLKPVKKRS